MHSPDLLRRALEAEYTTSTPARAGRGDDLGAAVVAVEPGLGDEDLHGFFTAGTSSVTSSARRREPATVSRASEIGSLNRRGPALPGFR